MQKQAKSLSEIWADISPRNKSYMLGALGGATAGGLAGYGLGGWKGAGWGAGAGAALVPGSMLTYDTLMDYITTKKAVEENKKLKPEEVAGKSAADIAEYERNSRALNKPIAEAAAAKMPYVWDEKKPTFHKRVPLPGYDKYGPRSKLVVVSHSLPNKAAVQRNKAKNILNAMVRRDMVALEQDPSNLHKMKYFVGLNNKMVKDVWGNEKDLVNSEAYRKMAEAWAPETLDKAREGGGNWNDAIAKPVWKNSELIRSLETKLSKAKIALPSVDRQRPVGGYTEKDITLTPILGAVALMGLGGYAGNEAYKASVKHQKKKEFKNLESLDNLDDFSVLQV